MQLVGQLQGLSAGARPATRVLVYLCSKIANAALCVPARANMHPHPIVPLPNLKLSRGDVVSFSWDTSHALFLLLPGSRLPSGRGLAMVGGLFGGMGNMLRGGNGKAPGTADDPEGVAQL